MTGRISKQFLGLSYASKRIIMICADSLMLVFGLWGSFSLRWGEWYVPQNNIGWLIVAAPVLAVPIFVRFGLYRAIVRYIGFHALWAVVQAVSLYALAWGVLVALSGLKGIPRSVILINWLVAILLIGGSRMLARWWFAGVMNLPLDLEHKRGVRKRVIIYGAGSAGVQLASALAMSREYRPIGYIDDNPALHNREINGLRVFSFSYLGQMIEVDLVEEVLLALPSVSRSRRKQILTLLEPYPVHVRTLPGVAELARGEVKIDDVREVSIEDLLGRDIVPPNQDLLHRNITGKVVMVTGAGGSIGSELCRQIVQLKPLALLLFEQSEFALYSIDWELKSIAAEGQVELVPLLGSVLDSARVKEVIQAYGVHTLYHAAAYKHVPMVERNPAEAVVNNALGTWHVAMVANECKIETFVLISTDKAVRPTNTMGATKRLAELICQGIATREGKVNTRFSMVRFGNVLGSSGSVVPLFREQIRNGGPLTVTDPKMIRYFMTIPEASQLVIQAGAMAEGGDIFVLDMGVPVKIIDLAERMVHLSGFEVKDDEHPNGDIEIVFTGLRPGEKLYEELLIGDDVQPTSHPLIMRSQEEAMPWPKLDGYLSELEKAALAHDQVRIRELLLESVSGYKPQCGIEDNVLRRMSSSVNGKVYSLTPK